MTKYQIGETVLYEDPYFKNGRKVRVRITGIEESTRQTFYSIQHLESKLRFVHTHSFEDRLYSFEGKKRN